MKSCDVPSQIIDRTQCFSSGTSGTILLFPGNDNDRSCNEDRDARIFFHKYRVHRIEKFFVQTFIATTTNLYTKGQMWEA